MVDKTMSYRLNSLEETITQLDKEECKIIAGGTDVMVFHKGGRGIPVAFNHPVVFIDHLQELKKIYSEEQSLHIGACCTYDELLDSPLIPEVFKRTIKDIAAPAIRNRGTLGGNICNASPAGDTLPLLYVYNARLLLRSIAGERIVAIKDFIQGPRKIDRCTNEILVEIILPNVLETDTRYVFEKVANRRADAIAKISFAGAIQLDQDKIASIRFVFGSVGATMVYDEEVEQMLIGKTFPLDDEVIDAIIADFGNIIKPIDDQRSTAQYRKTVALKLLRHFLESQ